MEDTPTPAAVSLGKSFSRTSSGEYSAIPVPSAERSEMYFIPSSVTVFNCASKSELISSAKPEIRILSFICFVVLSQYIFELLISE